MKKKNGFIISTTLYGIFGLMLMTVATIIYVLANNRTVVGAMSEKVKMCAEECGTPEDICPTDTEESKGLIGKILANNKLLKTTVNTECFAVSETIYNNVSDHTYFTKYENGLYIGMSPVGAVYFFRGAVDNNYIRYKDLTWRILRIDAATENIKIILDDVIDYQLVDIDGNVINVSEKLNNGEDVRISQIHADTFLNGFLGRVALNVEYNDKKINFRNILSNSDDLNVTFKVSSSSEKKYVTSANLNKIGSHFYKSDNTSEKYVFYKSILDNWYNEKIGVYHWYKPTFCDSQFGIYKYDKYYYIPNRDFFCNNTVLNPSQTISQQEYEGENNLRGSEVGLLSYGELLMAGYTDNNEATKDKDIDTFIYNGKPFILGNLEHTYHNSSWDDDEFIYQVSRAKIDKVLNTSYEKVGNGWSKSLEYNGESILKWNGKKSDIYLRNLRPVIYLYNSEITVNGGDGTKENPYIIQ